MNKRQKKKWVKKVINSFSETVSYNGLKPKQVFFEEKEITLKMEKYATLQVPQDTQTLLCRLSGRRIRNIKNI